MKYVLVQRQNHASDAAKENVDILVYVCEWYLSESVIAFAQVEMSEGGETARRLFYGWRIIIFPS